jgi:hypothetical protein
MQIGTLSFQYHFRSNLPSLIESIIRIENKHFIVRFQEVGYVQGTNTIDSMYAMQTAMEVALKNSMLVSKLKVYGKSPRLFYLDPAPNQIEGILGRSLAGSYRDVSYMVCVRIELTLAYTLAHSPNAYFQSHVNSPTLDSLSLLDFVRTATCLLLWTRALIGSIERTTLRMVPSPSSMKDGKRLQVSASVICMKSSRSTKGARLRERLES